jgi:hypothetical protein
MKPLRLARAFGAALCLFSLFAHARTGRLLTTDAAEVVDDAVLGLQRTAIPIAGGFAVDTALLADLALVLNGGVRWAGEADVHRFVLGARYAHFVGTPVYSALLASQEPQLVRFEPTLSGPTFYAVYGVQLPSILLQVEGRYELMSTATASITAGARFNLNPSWALMLEAGYRFFALNPYRAAAGIRLGGESGGAITVGAAYVGIEDPMLPSYPILPVLDLSWSF